MGRRNRIEQLDPKIREQVDRLVRGGRTIDEITEHLGQMAGDDAPSRGSVGRYVKSAREQMEKYRQAQEVAKVWVGKIEEDPESNVGRLLSEMLRTVAFQTISQYDESEEGASAGELMFIAKAIKELASADKMATERAVKIRKEVLQEAVQVMEETAKEAGGLQPGTIKQIRERVMGIA